jgi:hypothetical protein
MKVISNQTGFVKVQNVEIPSVYSRRFKTGKEDLDAVFGGQGFLPGMSFTLAAGPGTGKTTMLIQMLEALERQNKKTAYVSAEESIHQLAFNCKRLGVQNVSVANMSVIEDIFDAVKKNKFDCIVLDSLPALTSRKKLRGRQLEEYLSNYITERAKELECVVGVILHFTKTGTYKGSTLLPHSVDCNIVMRTSKDNPTLREIEVTKNRFGTASFCAFMMTESGFDFESVELEVKPNEEPKKKGRIASYRDKVLEIIKEKGSADLSTITQALECSIKAQSTLRDLTLMGTLRKEGRGKEASWVLV